MQNDSTKTLPSGKSETHRESGEVGFAFRVKSTMQAPSSSEYSECRS